MRGLVRVPVLAATIVATVGLGIGSTTAIFAVMDAALLRPLPYPNPEQLVRIYTDTPPYKFRFSVADYQALEAQQTTFTKVAAYTDRSMAYSDGTNAERLRGRLVTWTYFDLLGITPALGRNFTQAEGRPGGPRSVIVTNAFWRDRLRGRPDVVGTAVRLDGVDYRLVGVLPATVGPLERGQELFVAGQWDTPRRKGPFFLITIGRLPSAGGLGAAAAELHAINKRLFPIWQSSYQDERATWGAMDLKTYLIGEFRPLARLAIAAVALVWLVACINASNLLLARVTSRRRELAVRTALGASRARVVGHLLSESAVLAVAACAIGVALAWAGIHAARTIGAPYIPRADEIVLGGRTLIALAAVTMLSVGMFGLIPAIHGAGGSVEEGLRSGSRSATGSRSARRLRGLLVAGQFAIATPLLIVAGLLIVSLSHLSKVNLGFDTHNVLTASVTLPTAQYPDDARVRTFWDRLRTTIGSVPGVAAVGFTDARPPNDANNQNNFDLEDYPAGPGRSQPVTTWVDVSPNYFELFGLSLVEGRLFDQRDTVTTAPSVVVVDQAWAKRFFPGRSAIGKRLKGGGCSTCDWTTVVGVVSVVKYDGLRAPDQGVVYTPMSETGEGLAGSQSGRSRYLVMRTALASEAVLPQIRRAVRDLDPSLPLSGVATIDGLVENSLDQPRGLSIVIGGLALVALVLSVIGIYGVMAHYVQQQMKDISIRLALGGTPTNVLQLVVGRGMTLVAWGIALGVGVSFVLARMLSSLLFGVGATDPLTFTTVTALMLGAALAACAVPAARAARVEPAVVLRND